MMYRPVGFRPNLLVSLIAISAAITVGHRALAKDCPVSITEFYFTSVGATKGLSLYQVGLLSESKGPVSVRFDIDDGGVTSSRTVYRTNVDFEPFPIASLAPQSSVPPSAKLVFAWPSKDVSAIAIHEVALGDKSVFECSSGWTPLTRAGLLQTAWKFDDHAVILGSQVPASLVSDAKFTHRVHPNYPEKAKENGIQGQVTIEILLDQTGRLVDSWVVRSSGDSLDQASLTAAKASTYGAPTADGQPIVATFTIYYVFELR